MKRNKFIKLGLTGILALANLTGIGCTSALINPEEETRLLQQVEKKPYVALFEGIQPGSGYTMQEVAEDLKRKGIVACATSGNYRVHMPLIRRAKEFGQKVHIAGFSMGEVEARDNLARMCKNEGIKVDTLILIDGPDLGMIHGNVKKVVDIWGIEPPYIFRRSGRYTTDNLESKNTRIKQYEVYGDHLSIPGNSIKIIEREILNNTD